MGTTAAAPVAVDLGGRWVGTYPTRPPQVAAELNEGMLRLGPTPLDVRDTYRFFARPGGPVGAAILVPVITPDVRVEVVYRLERGRLVIHWRNGPRDAAVTLRRAAPGKLAAPPKP